MKYFKYFQTVLAVEFVSVHNQKTFYWTFSNFVIYQPQLSNFFTGFHVTDQHKERKIIVGVVMWQTSKKFNCFCKALQTEMLAAIPTFALHALTEPCLLRRPREALQGPLNQLDSSELAVMRLSSISPLSIPNGTEQPEDTETQHADALVTRPGCSCWSGSREGCSLFCLPFIFSTLQPFGLCNAVWTKSCFCKKTCTFSKSRNVSYWSLFKYTASNYQELLHNL